MTPNPSVNQTAPHSSDEYAALVHAAQDSGDWKPVVDWLARHPERAREFARFMDADDLTRRGLPPARASFSDLPGTVVDGYEIHEKLGSGGAGDVFRGYDPALKREVAVKVIHTGDPDRFRVEAERVAGMKHENIVPVFAFGETTRGPYLVMPLMTGGTLEDYQQACAGGRLPADEAARMVRGIALGIHHAHQRGLIHRDLKPLNVLLDEKCTPRIADFGLARPIDGTASVGIAGTFAYMAPEQARGDKALTTAVDVHALGAILFQLLTGRVPFGGGPSALQRVIADAAPALRELSPDVSKDLEAVCLKCLEKQPEHRYASAKDVADELDRYLCGEPVQARPPGFWDWVRQLARTQPERGVKYSWEVTAWFGALTLLTNVAVYAMVQRDAPAAGVWAANVLCSAGMGLALWWYMMRRFRQLPVTERHSLIIGAGHVIGYVPLLAAFVPLSLTVSARAGLAIYPSMTLLSGLGLFTLGSTNWSRFFPVGFVVMGLTPLMVVWPDESPLLFGGVITAVMWYWTLAKRRLGPPVPAA